MSLPVNTVCPESATYSKEFRFGVTITPLLFLTVTRSLESVAEVSVTLVPSAFTA